MGQLCHRGSLLLAAIALACGGKSTADTATNPDFAPDADPRYSADGGRDANSVGTDAPADAAYPECPGGPFEFHPFSFEWNNGDHSGFAVVTGRTATEVVLEPEPLMPHHPDFWEMGKLTFTDARIQEMFSLGRRVWVEFRSESRLGRALHPTQFLVVREESAGPVLIAAYEGEVDDAVLIGLFSNWAGITVTTADGPTCTTRRDCFSHETGASLELTVAATNEVRLQAGESGRLSIGSLGYRVSVSDAQRVTDHGYPLCVENLEPPNSRLIFTVIRE
jgi:hypothetical protein